MFLKDKRRANPELVYNTYYGENADPLASLATAGLRESIPGLSSIDVSFAGYLRPWWVGVVKDIEGQRKRALSPIEAAESFGRYLSSSILYHKSAMTSGAFRSTRVTQVCLVYLVPGASHTHGRPCRSSSARTIASRASSSPRA
jgi:hypothetical protein